MTLQKTTPVVKPKDSHWTDDQWDAIALQGHNILVAAAAGSGKTAVLVERIIRHVSDESHPLDVDRLLVATFTKAAASEMRMRIREALEKTLHTKPDSPHLRRQLALLNRASITTLHSFCMEVIQRYYALINLDPGFRIANDTEAALLRQDLLQELFEECYSEAGEEDDFWKLVDWYGGERSDEALIALVQKLYDDSRSHPRPTHWLKEKAAQFDTTNENLYENPYENPHENPDENELPWQRSLAGDVRLELSGIAGLLKEAIKYTMQPGGPAPYLENLQNELILIEYLQEVSLQTWDHMYQAFQSAAFGRLKPCKGDQIEKPLQDVVKQLRDRAKDQLKKLKSELFERTPEQFRAELQEMAPLMNVLTDLVIRFEEKYLQAKKVKGLLDFADLEHYCLAILCEPDSLNDPYLAMKPSRAAIDYQSQFVEVLLDEYQDTNRVQEAIIALLSRQSPGNRFIVGDVKQSIYRFRLAEPGLFLEKYRSYQKDGVGEGRRIDLARNFRSRRQVVDGVNYLFRQLMHETVGEVDYNQDAELVYNAGFPEHSSLKHLYAVEVMLIDRSANLDTDDESSPSGSEDSASDSDSSEHNAEAGSMSESMLESTEESQVLEPIELKTAEMEARTVGLEIRRLLGLAGQAPFQVFDKQIGGVRPATYRDIVILQRATRHWAPVFIEELKLQGVPAYAELSTGYFTATEMETVFSLLQIIDNPLQDIPLAAVLRSPLVGFNADELGQIRIVDRMGNYYEAVVTYSTLPVPDELSRKLKAFLLQLEKWRTEARQGSLADLIWGIYRETGYYDFVGGLPGGVQRQANLRALYDRARQYEATTFRGLFRFLRFIERMRKSGGDLGTARALGEQEDVVRIMSIHKSKGLEFPIVFVAGIGKMFNMQDVNSHFLLHKELGFGPKFVDVVQRISYPTLPMLAIKRRMRMEMLAEELRVLYVAMTRAKEKLYMVGTVPSLEKQLQQWGRQVECESVALPDYELAKARCYLDWIGLALIRHPHAEQLRQRGGLNRPRAGLMHVGENSSWHISIIEPALIVSLAAAASESAQGQSMRMEAVHQLLPVTLIPVHYKEEIERKLSWSYPNERVSHWLSKTSVSEMKSRQDPDEIPDNSGNTFSLEFSGNSMSEEFASTPTDGRVSQGSQDNQDNQNNPTVCRILFRRPKFIEQKKLSPAERGTVYHAVMQQVPLIPNLSEDEIRSTINNMLTLQNITLEQRQAIDPTVIASFFTTAIGQRLLNAKSVQRETPFSYGLYAGEIYPQAVGSQAQEMILIQGVVDCLFEEDNRLVLLDFKTDATTGLSLNELKGRYQLQIMLYVRAVEQIWKRPVTEKYLYFFDGAHLVNMD